MEILNSIPMKKDLLFQV